jgi:hypothetical protein
MEEFQIMAILIGRKGVYDKSVQGSIPIATQKPSADHIAPCA